MARVSSKSTVFCSVVLVYFITMSIHQSNVNIRRQEKEVETVHFVMIICGGEGDHNTHKQASELNRQIRQAEVMLKSAIILTKRKLHFHIIADSTDLYYRLVNKTLHWPEEYNNHLEFSMHDIVYPEDREDMRTMFRVCATERLFIPDLFPDLQKVIYVDTDLIFMRPPEDLWDLFDEFSENQIAAMAPCLNHYGTERNKVPYYGETGLNAGIMLMDLTRIQNIPDGWTKANMAIADKYKPRIKLADQDILNILFSFYPDKLYELPCEWNYRAFICSGGENKCPSAEHNGVAILHGNALAFVKGHEMKIQTIFESFEGFSLEESLNQLFTNIVAGLTRVDMEDMASKCKRINGIDKMLLGQLQRHLLEDP